MIGEPQQNISFAEFELDTAHRRLLRNGKPLSLYAKTFDLLTFLLERNGQVVTKDQILETVWEGQFVEEANLSVQVSALRKALGEKKNEPRFLVTVPGKGYKFVADIQTDNRELIIESRRVSRVVVEEEIEESGSGIEEKTSTLPKVLASRFTSQTIAIGAFVTLLLVASGFWLFDRDQNNGAMAPAVRAEKQTHIKRLTSKGTVSHGVLSPDGKFFAYSSREPGTYQSSLWIGQTTGNSDVQLFPVADLTYNPRSFSSDGNWLYYTVSEARGFENGTLYKMPVLGGVPQILLSNINVYVVLSPDEKQIAFVRGNKENKTSALVIANLDGSGEREITVRPAGQSLKSLSLSWSADGALVAFAAESGKEKSQEIFAANLADGSIKQVTSLEWIGISRIAWLRDGSGLMLSARDKNSLAANQLWQIDYGSGKAQNITRDLQHYASTLSLSADSSALLAIQSIVESHIWVAPAENLVAARQISFGSSGIEGWHGIDWTPDGNIVYTARIDQSLTVWTMDADGANARQITSAGFLDQNPLMTADGKFIVFQSNRSGATEIWRMNSDGSDLRQLTFDGHNSYPHSTPDGRNIVYTHTSNGTNSAWRVSIEGGEAIQITDAESYNARVSPDGNFIAYGHVASGKAKLAIMRITGGGPLKLFDVPSTYNFNGSIRWSRDGKFVSYRDWTNGVWQQSINGGELKRLTGLPAEKLYQYDWSPDGKQFAFTRGREVRDAVLITDFR